MDKMVQTKLVNGRVYERPNGGLFVAVWFQYDQWGMLHIDRHEIKGMSVPAFQHDEIGNYLFTEAELKLNWRSDEWKQPGYCLRIAKIDPDDSFTEYPIGISLNQKIEDDNHQYIKKTMGESIQKILI